MDFGLDEDQEAFRAAVRGVPITEAGLGLDDLVTYMRAQNIAPFKLPERLELFDELPRTAGGNLSKVTLRSAISERAAAG